MGFLFFLVFLGASCTGVENSTKSNAKIENAVRSLLDTQVQAWNRGDMQGFLDGYLKSSELIYASSGRIFYGEEQVHALYQEGFPEGAVGHLSFSELDVHPLGEKTAWTLARFRLETDEGIRTGIFTLIVKEAETGWRIVHEHSSAMPAASN